MGAEWGTWRIEATHTSIFSSAGFFLWGEDFGRKFDHSLPACTFFLFWSGDYTVHANITLSCQDQSTVAQSAEMTVAKCSLTSCVWACFWISSHTMPGTIIVSPLRLRWVKGVCVFRYNLPPALLAEWLGSFTCHWSNKGVEQTLNKSQHTKLTLEKKDPKHARD